MYPVHVALAIHSFVRVVSFSVNTSVLYDELKGGIHKATIATTVPSIGRALHKFLLWQCDHLTSNKFVNAFNCAYCRESPATSCMPLFNNNKLQTKGNRFPMTAWVTTVLTCMRVATLIILFKDNIDKLWFAVKYGVCLFALFSSLWGNFTSNYSYFSSCSRKKKSYKVSTGQNRRRAKTNFPTMVKQKRLGVMQHLINVSLEKEFS